MNEKRRTHTIDIELRILNMFEIFCGMKFLMVHSIQDYLAPKTNRLTCTHPNTLCGSFYSVINNKNQFAALLTMFWLLKNQFMPSSDDVVYYVAMHI